MAMCHFRKLSHALWHCHHYHMVPKYPYPESGLLACPHPEHHLPARLALCHPTPAALRIPFIPGGTPVQDTTKTAHSRTPSPFISVHSGATIPPHPTPASSSKPERSVQIPLRSLTPQEGPRTPNPAQFPTKNPEILISIHGIRYY